MFSSKVPLTLYGFAIAATWLDSIADKLVEILELFGILLEIPSTVLGLTVLAFGNSIQGETGSPPSLYETKQQRPNIVLTENETNDLFSFHAPPTPEPLYLLSLLLLRFRGKLDPVQEGIIHHGNDCVFCGANIQLVRRTWPWLLGVDEKHGQERNPC